MWFTKHNADDALTRFLKRMMKEGIISDNELEQGFTISSYWDNTMKEPEIRVETFDGKILADPSGKAVITEKIEAKTEDESVQREPLVAQILNEKDLTLYVELPGVEKEQIKVFLTEEPEIMIEIEAKSASKKIPAFKTKVRPKKKANIDPNGQFTTAFINGVLTIVFPLKETAKKKEIPIQ